MKLKFKMSWQHFIPDQVIETIPDGMANILIRRGIATELKEHPKPQIQGKSNRK